MARLLDMRGQVASNTIIALLNEHRWDKIWVSNDMRRLDYWIRLGAKPSQIITTAELGF